MIPNQADAPRARRDRLIVREMHDEVLVYDSERDAAICLNHFAAKVWRSCDGAATPQAIAEHLSLAEGIVIDERSIWLALDQLSKQHLLDDDVELPAELQNEHSRRDFLRALGTGAAFTLPVVVGIVVPTPAQAASCLATGMVCSSNFQCCSNLCVIGLVCA